MMILALAMATATPKNEPQKLIIVANDSAVAIEYPSRDRCLKAASAAEEEARVRLREAYANSTDPIVKPALKVIAFCIPG